MKSELVEFNRWNRIIGFKTAHIIKTDNLELLEVIKEIMDAPHKMMVEMDADREERKQEIIAGQEHLKEEMKA